MEVEFEKNPNWSYELKAELAIKLSFTLAQISKWLWDKKKKMGIPTDVRRGSKRDAAEI